MSRALPLATLLVSAVATADAAEKITFEDHVRPIFRQQCAACHNSDDAASDFAADGYDAALAGGASGEVLVAGDPAGSRLWRLINHDEEPVMPPGGEKLAEQELAVVRQWIEQGLIKDANSKPRPIKKSAIAQVDPTRLGKPEGEPAMPAGVARQPVVTSASRGPIRALAASPWAPVAAVGWHRQAALYHTETFRLLGVVPYLDGAPRVVRFSRDGSLLLIAGGQDASLGTAVLYDVKTGARVARLGEELDAVLAADVSPDNALVAIGGPSKKVRVYRTADGELAYTCEKHTDWITALAFSPDGKTLASADRASGLRLWQAARGHERADLRGHKQAITSLAWRRDGGVLASSSEDGDARLWNAKGGAIKSFSVQGGGAQSVAFAPDGKLVTTGRDGRVRLWNPEGGHVADLNRSDDVALAAVFSHDGSKVIASDWAGAVRVLDVAEKKAIADLAPNPPTLQERLAEATTHASASQQEAERAIALERSANEALESARQRHAEHESQSAAGQAALSTAQAALNEGLKVDAQREQAANAVASALAEVEKSLADANQRLASAAESDDRESLEQEVATAQSSVDSLAKAADTANALREESAKSLTQAREEATQAEALVARLADQVDGLPDLPALEAALAERSQQRKVQEAARTEAAKRRDEATAELSQYEARAQQLAEQQAAAAAALEAETKLAADAAELVRSAQESLVSAQAETKALEDRLNEMRRQLEAKSKAAQQAAAQLEAAEASLAEKQQVLNGATRETALVEALLDELREVQKFRDESTD